MARVRWRVFIDWAVTILIALVVVFGLEAEVAKPYRIPTSSMEPTLHCAKPGAWCEASHSDRVIVNRLVYRFESPQRQQIVVFTAPPLAAARCGEAGTYVKRLIGLPGDKLTERKGHWSVNGKPLERALPHRRRAWHRERHLDRAGRQVLLHGRRPDPLVRLAHVGLGTPEEPDRPGVRDVLAAQPAVVSLEAHEEQCARTRKQERHKAPLQAKACRDMSGGSRHYELLRTVIGSLRRF